MYFVTNTPFSVSPSINTVIISPTESDVSTETRYSESSVPASNIPAASFAVVVVALTSIPFTRTLIPSPFAAVVVPLSV